MVEKNSFGRFCEFIVFVFDIKKWVNVCTLPLCSLFNFKIETRHCIFNACLRYLTIHYFETEMWNTEREAVLFILLSFQIIIYWYRTVRIGNSKLLLALSVIVITAIRITTRASKVYYQHTHWYLNYNIVHFRRSIRRKQ